MPNKTIREAFGPVHERNSTIDKETLPEGKTPEFEVKYSSRKSGPIKVTKFMSQGEAQAFLKKIRGEGMQGIVSKGGKPVRTPMKEDAKSDRLAKIARAADAREKDQAKEKAKATEKHNQNSAKSRAGIDYLKKGGNKDQFGRVRENTSDDDDDATFAKKRRTHVRNSARKVKAAMNDYGTNPSRKNAKRADAVNLGHDMVKRTWKDSAAKRRAAAKNEEFEITESDKAEYDKLMKQYGDMPASKIPPKTYMRISQLGRKVRGDKGGPKVGDLLKSMKQKKMGEAVVDEAFSPSIIKKMKQVLDRTGTGDINLAMKINDTLPKDAKKVLSKVKNSKELDKYLKANEEVDQVDEATRKPSKIKKGTTFFDKKVPETKPKPSILKRKYSEEKSADKVIGEESIKINGGSAVEIGKNERGSKTQYYWKDKSGLKNVFDTLEKMRYSLRNDGNFRGAEKVTKQLGESLRQRADDSMTFSNRQAAFSAAFMKAHSRKPTKQELRDAGVGKGGDNPAGAKAYQKAISKLRPASRSGIKDKFVHNEEFDQVDEAKMGAIARNVKKGDSPYTVVAIVNKKVVDQDHAKVADQVPALVRELQKEYPNAKISIEDRGGRVVHSESFEAGISEEVDGWVAMYNGKRLEIPNDGKVKGIAGAKAKAIKDLKVPKSKIGMLAIKPAVNEGRIGGGRRSFRGSGMKHIRIRDDEGYRKDGSNPVDDAIRRRNDARRRAAAAQKAKQTNKDPKKKFEDVEIEEGGMIGRTKPSRELNVSREEKPHLAGKSSLKDKKRDAHKAERAKAKKQLKSFKEY